LKHQAADTNNAATSTCLRPFFHDSIDLPNEFRLDEMFLCIGQSKVLKDISAAFS
jgi:hypothetical protein